MSTTSLVPPALAAVLFLSSCVQPAPAQDKPQAPPRLVTFWGVAANPDGKPNAGVAGVTFALYKDEQGGAPLWMETQNVPLDAAGGYTAQIGATHPDGLPMDLFGPGQARWLEVQVDGQPAAQRGLLASVPYALKAVDAQTLGGLPASAFALAGTPAAAPGYSALTGPAKSAKPDAGPDLTGTGTANYLAYWSNSTTLGSAALYQTAGKVGLGTITPGTQLEVDSATESAILGNATASTGAFNGVGGQTASASGSGVSGLNTNAAGGNGVTGASNATSGYANGVYGQTASVGGSGVWGQNVATTGYAVAVTGQTASPGGIGVVGMNNATTGGNGVNGIANATSGFANGVFGQSSSPGGNGVVGYSTAGTGFASGVYGQSTSTSGAGLSGWALSATGGTAGVYGNAASTGGVGVFGSASATTGYNVGVNGFSSSTGGFGVQGNSPNIAVAGINQICTGSTCTMVKGIAGQFVTAAGGTILEGLSGTTEVFSVDSKGDGHFSGNLTVTGKLTKGSGSFKIDHPLDPANKYLSHSFVESPDMMDVYNGIIRLDATGQAWVTLPDYFEALNGDFRYQLTAIGAPAPRLYVAREVSENRFRIAGGRPCGRVSRQVTGIRHDAYANAHRIPVTEDKPAEEQGRYLHPDVYAVGGSH